MNGIVLFQSIILVLFTKASFYILLLKLHPICRLRFNQINLGHFVQNFLENLIDMQMLYIIFQVSPGGKSLLMFLKNIRPLHYSNQYHRLRRLGKFRWGIVCPPLGPISTSSPPDKIEPSPPQCCSLVSTFH